MVALADTVESVTLVAEILTVCEEVIEAGAEYNPFLTVPIGGASDQTTAGTAVPPPVAVNCWV
jgi:hypothetical protein